MVALYLIKYSTLMIYLHIYKQTSVQLLRMHYELSFDLTRGIPSWLDKWLHTLHTGLLRAYRVMEIERA